MQRSPRTPARRTPRPVWLRVQETLRASGPAGLLFLVLSDLGYRRVLLLERRLDGPIASVRCALRVAFSRLEKAQIDEYLEFYEGDDRAQLEARFARGDTGFVARHEGRIVCTSWAARGEHHIRFVDHRYPVGASEVYLYDSYTDPAFRGRSVAPALGVWVLEQLQGEGVSRVTMAVTPENTANRRARAKTGFRVFGRISCLRFAGRTFHRQRGAPA